MYSNWGTESDPEFKGHHNGNSDPRGFGKWYLIWFDIDFTPKALVISWFDEVVIRIIQFMIQISWFSVS